MLARAALSVAFPGAARRDTGGPHDRPRGRGPAARDLASRGASGPRGLPLRRLARRRRAAVVAGAPADPARPPRLPLREPLRLRGLARPAGTPAGPRDAPPRSPTSASATPTGSATGPASPAATRWPTRCASSASGGRCVIMQTTVGCGSWAICPSTLRPTPPTCAPTPGSSAATRWRASRRTPSRPTASSGATPPTTGRPCARTATAGGSSACAARAIWLLAHASITSGPSWPGGACRRGRARRAPAAGTRGPRTRWCWPPGRRSDRCRWWRRTWA